jgi:hypothetical protein
MMILLASVHLLACFWVILDATEVPETDYIAVITHILTTISTIGSANVTPTTWGYIVLMFVIVFVEILRLI